MATTYTFRFTDPDKAEFYVAAYTGDGWENPNSSSTLMLNADGNTATSANTTLKLYGKGMPEYGQGVMQDLIYVLENFANDEAPNGAIEGQLWYNNDTDILSLTHDGTVWDGILLASGGSANPMTGDLYMGGNWVRGLPIGTPTDGSMAISLTYAVNTYLAKAGGIMTGNIQFGSSAQILLDDGTATDPALTFTSDTNTGIFTDTADTIKFSTGSTERFKIESDGTLSVPASASYETLVTDDDDIPNKKYVDDEITAGTVGASLASISFNLADAGSPPTADSTANSDYMTFIKGDGSSITVYGLDYDGKLKPADEITFTPSAGLSSTDVQAAITEVKSESVAKAGDGMTGALDMGGNFISSVSTPAAPTDAANKAYVDNINLGQFSNRIFLTDGINDTYTVFDHLADGNKLQVYMNGQKQTKDTSGLAELLYDRNIDVIDSASFTYIDESVLDYAFDVVVDGGSPIAPITITIPLITSGSPPVPISTVDISTHGALLAEINNQLAAYNITMNISGFDNGEDIKSTTYGSSSSITITAPSGSPATYLFDIPALLTVTAINYTAGSPFGVGSPLTYDSFEVDGDQTASFPVGRKFTLINSATDDTGNPNIDGVYTVVSATASVGSPLTTTIEVEEEIWQDGTVTTLGDISLTHVAGLISNNSTAGLDLDYQALDVDGNVAERGSNATQVKFNTLPPASSVVEIIKIA